MDKASTHHRRKLRLGLSVRALMVCIALLAGAFGWLVIQARVQRNAVAAIRDAEGVVYYDWEFVLERNDFGGAFGVMTPDGHPRGPTWLVKSFGVDYLNCVRRAGVLAQDDAIMFHLGRLSHLQELSVQGGGEKCTNSGLANLSGLTELRFLTVRGLRSKFTGEGLKGFARSKKT